MTQTRETLNKTNKLIRHVVYAGSLGRVKPIHWVVPLTLL